MSRDVLARLDDMIAAAQLVIQWTQQVQDLQTEIGLRYQIERALEILGEAAKHVPEQVRVQAPDFPWRKTAGLRDVLAHAYFDIDPDVLTSVGLDALPAALPSLLALRQRLAGG